MSELPAKTSDQTSAVADASAHAGEVFRPNADAGRIVAAICPECGIVFGVIQSLHLAASVAGRPVYCSNGHGHPLPKLDSNNVRDSLRVLSSALATATRDRTVLLEQMAARTALPAPTIDAQEMQRRYQTLFNRAEDVRRLGDTKKICRFCGKGVAPNGASFRRHLRSKHAAQVAALPPYYFD